MLRTLLALAAFFIALPGVLAADPTPASAPRPVHLAKLRSPVDGQVRLNRAGRAELMRLPGVGPAIAGRILAYRTRVGGFFVDPIELQCVPGIGLKTFNRLAPLVRL